MFASSPVAFSGIPRPAFGRAAQHLPRTAAATPYRARAEARYRRAARTAAELLPELPDRSEVVHCLMLGTYDLAQVITATVPRLPALRHLRIATLCYSRRNTVELLSLLESRPTLHLTFLASGFFKRHNAEVHERFVEALRDYHPRAKIGTAESHCKVVLFDIADDDALVFEGSANLRTNKNREQLTVFRDRGLHDWHSSWIDDLVSRDDAGTE